MPRTPIQPLARVVAVLANLHALLSAILAFLFGLAIRNMLKVQ